MTVARWAELSAGRATLPRPDPPVQPWWGEVALVDNGGSSLSVYRIGDVARAVGRSPGTIRRWEATGILPKCPYRTGTVNDWRAHRRAYPATYVQAVAVIAEEEGVIGASVACLATHRFVQRVWEEAATLMDIHGLDG